MDYKFDISSDNYHSISVFYLKIGDVYHNLTLKQVSYAQIILLFEVLYMVISFLSNTLNGIILGFENIKLVLLYRLLGCLLEHF